jgi:bifunctional ADP-heptose synthase (sugar kinase/adenylyltransferase)
VYYQTFYGNKAILIAAGLDEFKASEIANLAGGLVCEHVGVVPIDKLRLLEESRKL